MSMSMAIFKAHWWSQGNEAHGSQGLAVYRALVGFNGHSIGTVNGQPGYSCSHGCSCHSAMVLFLCLLTDCARA